MRQAPAATLAAQVRTISFLWYYLIWLYSLWLYSLWLYLLWLYLLWQVRTIFLIWYSTLNAVLYTEAYYRHKGSPVGLALRGEAFFVCAGPDGLTRPCVEGPTSVPAGPLPVLQDVGAGVAYPYAKGFGQLLNLNCALMLLPVFRKV